MKAVKILWALVAALFAVWLYAFLSSVVIRGDIDWYVNLTKPVFAPVPDVMTFVWCVIYVFYVVILTRLISGRHSGRIVAGFIGAIVLNFVFVILFFGFEVFLPALIYMYFLLAVWILIMIMLFVHDKPAFFMSAPCFAWILFLTILLHCTYLMNI